MSHTYEPSTDGRHVGLMVYGVELNHHLDLLTLARRLGLHPSSVRAGSDPLSAEVRLLGSEQGDFWRGVHCNADSVYDVRFLGVERVEQVSFPPADGINHRSHDLAVSIDHVLVEGVVGHCIRLHDESVDAQIVVVPREEFVFSGHSKPLPTWVETLVGDNIYYDYTVLSWRLAIGTTGVVAQGHAYVSTPVDMNVSSGGEQNEGVQA